MAIKWSLEWGQFFENSFRLMDYNLRVRNLPTYRPPQSPPSPRDFNQTIVPGVVVFPAPPPASVPPIQTTPGFGSPNRFPRLPGANDPVFDLPGGGGIGGTLGRLLSRGVGAVSIGIILADIIRMSQEIDLNKQQRERDAEDILNQRRSGKNIFERKGPRLVKIFDPPAPKISDFPEFPLPQSVPEPAPRPRIVERPVFDPRQLPTPQAPAPVALPNPRPGIPTPRVPAPTPKSSPSPKPFALPNPFLFPGIRFNPWSNPRSLPRNLPRSFPPGDLTPIESPVPQLPPTDPNLTFNPNPDAQPQQQTDKCQNVARRRRKKGKCREGFFKESAGGTKYITWREESCGISPKVKGPNLRVIT